jgi:hypothetical protein
MDPSVVWPRVTKLALCCHALSHTNSNSAAKRLRALLTSDHINGCCPKQAKVIRGQDCATYVVKGMFGQGGAAWQEDCEAGIARAWLWIELDK